MNILVLEDHAATREAIVATLADAFDARLVDVADIAGVRDALAAPGMRFDVAVLDLSLRGESGLDALSLLSERGVPSIMLTMSDEGDDVAEALSRGAVGYLLKEDGPATIVRAVRDALSGRHPISSGVTHHLMPVASAAAQRVAAAGLTSREVDVLVALARGLSYGEAADALGCALGTIQTHVKRVYGKLGVNSKTEACAWAYSAGLVQ